MGQKSYASGVDLIQSELKAGRFSERVAAYLLDTLPFVAGAALTVYALAGPLAWPMTPRVLILVCVLWAGLMTLYQALGNLSGATPGKSLLGLRVVTTEGVPPGILRAAGRALAWLFLSTPFGSLGFLLALAHPRGRALHDLIAGTYVVEAGPRRSSGALAFVLAASAACVLFVGQFVLAYLRPTPDDLAALVRARRGLDVIAAIQEAYKGKHGTYADSIAGLAEASGDPVTFRLAMRELFTGGSVRIEAGNLRWRLSAVVKDRRRTVLSREGP